MPVEPGIEASCTAGITDKGEWLRLFPVPYRWLDPDKRFTKYQWIDVDVKRSRNDARPESYRLTNSDAIRIASRPLSSASNWRARKEAVAPLLRRSLCCIQRERDENGHPTLGLFRPKSIDRFRIAPTESAWSEEQLRMLSQTDLFPSNRPGRPLEKIPFNFLYDFHCGDAGCKGHTMHCTDWEIGAAWRKWKNTYGDNWETKFRETFETKMIEHNDTHFFVGTMHAMPSRWILVGLFYPPRQTARPGEATLDLF
jgi:hypothetical protein